jgi:hypothetical protein
MCFMHFNFLSKENKFYHYKTFNSKSQHSNSFLNLIKPYSDIFFIFKKHGFKLFNRFNKIESMIFLNLTLLQRRGFSKNQVSAKLFLIFFYETFAVEIFYAKKLQILIQ